MVTSSVLYVLGHDRVRVWSQDLFYVLGHDRVSVVTSSVICFRT